MLGVIVVAFVFVGVMLIMMQSVKTPPRSVRRGFNKMKRTGRF